MTRSEQINELAVALSKAQGMMQTAKKGAENPHFKSKYADLAAVWEACRSALTGAGLSVLQSPRLTMVGSAAMVEVETLLLHTSGQWVADVLTVPVSKVDAQGVGSAITYARRYALAAFASVAPDDDDGNAAVSGGPVVPVAPKGYDDWKADMESAGSGGAAALKSAWSETPSAIRAHAQLVDRDWMAALRKKAADVTEAA